jgi:hypothetical protein
VDLNFGPAFSKTFGASFDLKDLLPGGGFGSGVLSGGANLQASGSADIALSFGLDLGLKPEDISELDKHIYLLDSTAAGNKTGISGSLTATAEDLTFRAGLGPLGILVSNGKVRIGGGLLSGDANFTLDLTTNST